MTLSHSSSAKGRVFSLVDLLQRDLGWGIWALPVVSRLLRPRYGSKRVISSPDALQSSRPPCALGFGHCRPDCGTKQKLYSHRKTWFWAQPGKGTCSQDGKIQLTAPSCPLPSPCKCCPARTHMCIHKHTLIN